MTDRELVIKKLAFLESRLRELRTRVRPEKIETDVEHSGFVERSLQVTVQAAMDVASHIVSDEQLGEPRRNRDMFELLQRHGWLPLDLVDGLVRMVSFRNILVHGYEVVDPKIVGSDRRDESGRPRQVRSVDSRSPVRKGVARLRLNRNNRFVVC